MYFHRRQTCTKRLSTPKFVTCNLKSELKLFQPYTTQTNMKTLALSDILDEFKINRLSKLMFRTVVNSFFLEGQTDGRTDRWTDIASDDIRRFSGEKKALKIYTNL